VERLAGEAVDALDGGELGLVHQAPGGHEELGTDPVASLGDQIPAVGVVVPGQRFDLGLEQGVLVEPEVAGQDLAVAEDLRGARVLLRRHVAGLLEQRQVDGGIHVAHAARVSVPVPGAAEVGRLVDDPEVRDPSADQVDGGQHAGPPAAQHHDVNVVRDRLAAEVGVGPRIPVEGVFVEGLVLAHPVVPEPLLPLDLVAGLRRVD
jgi:hypothetical protein